MCVGGGRRGRYRHPHKQVQIPFSLKSVVYCISSKCQGDVNPGIHCKAGTPMSAVSLVRMWIVILPKLLTIHLAWPLTKSSACSDFQFLQASPVSALTCPGNNMIWFIHWHSVHIQQQLSFHANTVADNFFFFSIWYMLNLFVTWDLGCAYEICKITKIQANH